MPAANASHVTAAGGRRCPHAVFVKKVRGSGVELRLEFRQTRNPKGGPGRLDYRSYQMQNLEQDPEDSPR